MIGNARVIYEVADFEGQEPSTQIDTDKLSPPTFEDVVNSGTTRLQIAPADADIAVSIPVSCSVLIEADEAVILRLQAGETPMRIRHFYVGADDSGGAAVPARTLLFTGNGSTTANVRIVHLGQVS